jgi:hypothetical protein
VKDDDKGILKKYAAIRGTGQCENMFSITNGWLFGYHNSIKWAQLVIHRNALRRNVQLRAGLPVSNPRFVSELPLARALAFLCATMGCSCQN